MYSTIIHPSIHSFIHHPSIADVEVHWWLLVHSSTHHCTIHLMPVITRLWMNLWTGSFFFGDEFHVTITIFFFLGGFLRINLKKQLLKKLEKIERLLETTKLKGKNPALD
jgi:hypothetical protein